MWHSDEHPREKNNERKGGLSLQTPGELLVDVVFGRELTQRTGCAEYRLPVLFVCAATAASSATAPWAVRRAAGTGCSARGRQETCCPAVHGEATCRAAAGETPAAAEAVAAEGVSPTEESPGASVVTSGEEASVTDVSETKAPGATEVSVAAEIAAAVASVIASAVALRCTASTAGATHEAVRRGLRAAASRAAYCNNASGEAIHAENSAGNASARLSRAKAASSAISELTMPAAHAGNSSGVRLAGHAICSAARRSSRTSCR